MQTRCLGCAFFIVAFWASAAPAALTRLDITSREPFQDGQTFGDVGPYELLKGKAHFAIDPAAAANAMIVDLEFAPRNDAGLVEFSADVEILQPANLANANGAVLYDVNNRGNRLALGMFNDGTDGFLMEQGFIIAWSGWIAEILPGDGRLILDAPVATQNGEPITGLVTAEFVSDSNTNRYSIAHFGNQGSFEPTSRGLESAQLTWRMNERDARVAIPREQWTLHQQVIEADGRRSALPLIELEVAGGIRAGYIYEFIYEAQGPIVQGVGLAGIRDLISFLKHDDGTQNPVNAAGDSAADYAYGFGVSQSGRCLRQFLYDGFNADEQGRIVFDGVIPHVAGAGMGFFNHRFASPTRHNSQHDNHQFPADVFPFTYGEETDPFTGQVDGILRRASEADVVPKVMHVQTSSEYWHRAGSLVHTDPAGTRDAVIPDDVRIYTIGGAQHGAGSGTPDASGAGEMTRNPTDYRPLLRALLLALDAWVRDGIEPPASVYPRIADGTLVGWGGAESGWRPLPNVRYPEVIHQPDFVDRGPEFETLRRITVHPPRLIDRYTVRIPGFDESNNERGCLILPTVAVPLGSFTGWYLRPHEIGAETELLSLAGGYIPFARTEAERLASGDSRPSIESRYAGFDDYRTRFEAHTRSLVERGYLLEEDVPRVMQLADGQKRRSSKSRARK